LQLPVLAKKSLDAAVMNGSSSVAIGFAQETLGS
jgi:hypothetical protein